MSIFINKYISYCPRFCGLLCGDSPVRHRPWSSCCDSTNDTKMEVDLSRCREDLGPLRPGCCGPSERVSRTAGRPGGSCENSRVYEPACAGSCACNEPLLRLKQCENSNVSLPTAKWPRVAAEGRRTETTLGPFLGFYRGGSDGRPTQSRGYILVAFV